MTSLSTSAENIWPSRWQAFTYHQLDIQLSWEHIKHAGIWEEYCSTNFLPLGSSVFPVGRKSGCLVMCPLLLLALPLPPWCHMERRQEGENTSGCHASTLLGVFTKHHEQQQQMHSGAACGPSAALLSPCMAASVERNSQLCHFLWAENAPWNLNLTFPPDAPLLLLRQAWQMQPQEPHTAPQASCRLQAGRPQLQLTLWGQGPCGLGTDELERQTVLPLRTTWRSLTAFRRAPDQHHSTMSFLMKVWILEQIHRDILREDAGDKWIFSFPHGVFWLLD